MIRLTGAKGGDTLVRVNKILSIESFSCGSCLDGSSIMLQGGNYMVNVKQSPKQVMEEINKYYSRTDKIETNDY